MADDPKGGISEQHPVLVGMLALVAVALSVGLIMGGAALAGTKVAGVGGSADSGVEPSSEQTMYLPPPERTTGPTGPLITLNDPADDPTTKLTEDKGGPKRPEVSNDDEAPISLAVGQNEVSQMEPIDLSGVYPGGEGRILAVQQFKDGAWTDFPVSTSVSNETFSTVIQASLLGRNRFRVVDTDSGRVSNEVRVLIN